MNRIDPNQYADQAAETIRAANPEQRRHLAAIGRLAKTFVEQGMAPDRETALEEITAGVKSGEIFNHPLIVNESQGQKTQMPRQKRNRVKKNHGKNRQNLN